MIRSSKYFKPRILIVFLLVVVYYLSMYLSFSGISDKHYTREETIRNFKDKENEINDLVNYFRKIKPASREVWFKPEGNRFDIAIGLPGWPIMEKFPNLHGSALKLGSKESHALLDTLNWTSSDVIDLAEKIEKANCLSISSDVSRIIIEYRTGTWSGYSYIIHERPLTDSVKNDLIKAGVIILRENITIGYSAAL